MNCPVGGVKMAESQPLPLQSSTTVDEGASPKRQKTAAHTAAAAALRNKFESFGDAADGESTTEQ